MSATTQSRAARLRAEHEARKAREAKERKRKIVLLTVGGVLAAAALIGIAIGVAASGKGGTSKPPGITKAGGIVVGASSAPVKVVMYEDPQCPSCKRFEDGDSGKLLAQAAKDGKVSVEYRMRSFLGPESVRAVNALAAAHADGKFEALRELMFANQPQERTGGYTTSILLDLGKQAGITSSAYRDAVENMTYERWVRDLDTQGSKDGNVQTPELRIGGTTLPPAQMYDAAQLKVALKL